MLVVAVAKIVVVARAHRLVTPAVMLAPRVRTGVESGAADQGWFGTWRREGRWMSG